MSHLLNHCSQVPSRLLGDGVASAGEPRKLRPTLTFVLIWLGSNPHSEPTHGSWILEEGVAMSRCCVTLREGAAAPWQLVLVP
jgi:hypothetical protein